MGLISKGLHISKTSAADIFEQHVENPSTLVDKREKLRKDLKPTAERLRVTVETEGWKEVIQPLLEKFGNPKLLLQIYSQKFETETARGVEIGKIEAYSGLLTVIGNYLQVLEDDETAQ